MLSGEELDAQMAGVRALLEDETSHATRPPHGLGPLSSGAATHSASDLLHLKQKFPFLSQYFDDFIRASGPLMLVKAEAASRKLQEFDRGRKAEDKLLANRESLSSTTYAVEAGFDNRLDLVHTARFLPGAACSFAKLWLKARD